MNKRAYSTLEIKSTGTQGGKRVFSGIASTPSTDRMGDIVVPKGAKFKLPLPLLWQHDSHDPIGWINAARVTDKGIDIDGEVADVAEPGPLKDRLSMAWQMLTAKLVRGLSIGFKPIDSEPIDPKRPWGETKFLTWEWLELSAVTIPANQDASIHAIKSIDDRLRAESDRTRRLPAPGASGSLQHTYPPTSPKGKTMKVFNQESLAALQSARQEKSARMAELLEQKGEGFSEEQRAEFEGLKTEIRDTDDEIAVCETHVGNISRAKPIEPGRAPYGFARKFTDAEPKFKGEIGIKRFIATTVAQMDAQQRGIYQNPSVVCERMFGKSNPTLVAIMKANEVAGGGTGSGEWGAELAQVDTRYTGDFVEYLYGMTVFDRLPLRPVPHNVAIKGQDGAFTGYWVGESKPIPMSKGDYSTTSTAPLKVAGLTVMSNELLRDSSPAALGLAGDGLREAIAQIVDTTFLSTAAAVSGVSPAGILNSVSIGSSSGNDAFSIADDLQALFAPFITAKNTSGGFALVMTPTLALSLSLMRNALGQVEFPTITGTGGTFNGVQVFVGDNVGVGDVILMKPSDIWKIGDLGVSLSVSTEAMIEQSSAPTGATDTPVAASQAFTSMFQEESTAIKIVRPINWGKRRAGAVSYIGNAAWGVGLS